MNLILKIVLVFLMIPLSACTAAAPQPQGQLAPEGPITNASRESQVAIANGQESVAANVGGNAQVVVNGKVFSRPASYSSQIAINGMVLSGNELSLSSSDGKTFVNNVEVPEGFSGILKTSKGDVLVERQ